MKDLIILGAGGFGRELLQWVKDINRLEKKWQIKGFLDDNLKVLDGKKCDYGILGKIQDWQPSENEEFALAIANPQTKENVTNLLKSRGGVFAEIIHPGAKICDFAEWGEGLVMYPGAVLNPNCQVGNFVTLLASAVPHDAVIGDFVTISSNCGLTRGVRIGKRAFLADHACVLPEHKIGEDAYVGMGSVVVRNVPAGKKVFGNPARVIDL